MNRESMIDHITNRMLKEAIQSIQDGDYDGIEGYIKDWVGLNHKTLREVIDIYNSYNQEDA